VKSPFGNLLFETNNEKLCLRRVKSADYQEEICFTVQSGLEGGDTVVNIARMEGETSW